MNAVARPARSVGLDRGRVLLRAILDSAQKAISAGHGATPSPQITEAILHRRVREGADPVLGSTSDRKAGRILRSG